MRDYLCSNFNSQTNVQSLPMVSSNGYYGYQPVINQPDNRVNDYQNQMEVDSHSFCENVYVDRNIQPFNRKRQNTEPLEVQTFKKRRQNGNFQPVESSKPKFGRKPTHNLPDIPRKYVHAFNQNKENVPHKENITEEEFLAQTHGSSLHHWQRESDL